MTDLAKLVVKLELQAQQYQAALEKAEARLQKFDKASSTFSTAIGTAIGGALVKAGEKLLQFGAAALQNADHLNKLSQSTGVSVESLSRMQHAANLADVDIDSLAKSLGKMNKAAADAARGNDTAKKAFEALDVGIKNADGSLRSTEDILLDVADRFSKLSDGATKSALAQEIFGKAGARMIPFLNQGKEGIRAMMLEADALGLTLSKDTAQAAEDFNDNLTRLKGVAQGLANAFLREAAPTLEVLTKGFIDTAKSGDKLNRAAEFMSNLFKVLVSGGVIVASVFKTLGTVVGGVAAALVEAAHGRFRAAAGILSEAFDDAKSDVTDDLETIAEVWSDQVPKLEKTAEDIDKSLDKTIIFNDDKAAKKAESAAEAAVKALREMALDVQAQVDAFGKGEVALIKYRIAHGDLAEKVRVGGEEARKFADTIIQQTEALERLKTAQDLADVDQQILELTGHTAEAAEAAFDLQNALLKASLIDQGDEKGLERLNTLRKLVVEQERFNELEIQAEEIRDRLSETEERISHSQEVGAISQLEAMAQLGDAREKAVQDLNMILQKQDEIAASSDNPAIKRAANENARALEKLAEQTDLLGQAMRKTFEEAGGDALASFLEGEETALGAVKGFFEDLEREAIRFIAKDIFRQVANSVFGDGGGGSGGGGFWQTATKFFGALFGGGSGQTGTTMDAGGDAIPGRAVLIGRRAQPEWFVPPTRGKFIPAGAMGGNVTVNAPIYAPQGTISRQTQLEGANKIGRAVNLALRRNG